MPIEAELTIEQIAADADAVKGHAVDVEQQMQQIQTQYSSSGERERHTKRVIRQKPTLSSYR